MQQAGDETIAAVLESMDARTEEPPPPAALVKHREP